MPTRRRGDPPADHVHELVAGWHRERPDLPVEPVEVVLRVGRLAAHFAGEIEKVFAGSPVTAADFAVLANLRRAGAPYRLSQRQLMEVLQLTSGTVSVRIDRLVRAGLVERVPDTADARGVLVVLTEAGERLFDELAPAHLRNEARLVVALSPDEQEQLARLLQLLLVEYEPVVDQPGAGLGLRVLPAHVSAARRTGVGLPARPGLLVETVDPGGPAAVAGLRTGDLLVRAAGRPLRSLSCLSRAVEGRARVTIDFVRGVEEQSVTVGNVAGEH